MLKIRKLTKNLACYRLKARSMREVSMPTRYLAFHKFKLEAFKKLVTCRVEAG